jgi:hypothetical protein
MRSLLALFLLFFVLNSFSADRTLFINFSFTGIEEGYDHENKIIVYVDGRKTDESSVRSQSKNNFCRIKIPQGKHTIKVENWAYYDGNWELHDKANGYSQTLINTESIDIKKNMVMRILYDLDNGVEVSVK